jgi:beta-1,4-N-acetylglucosaminyltransferase
MILVMVGMHTQSFDRLVRAADEVASFIDEPMVIQRGISQYKPAFSRYFDFASETQIQELLSEARIVISHSGAGSVLIALQADKPLIVVPRLKCFNEVFDDHQLELAETLAQQDRVVAVTDLSAEALGEAITQATQLTNTGSVSTDLQSALRVWLTEQAVQSTSGQWKLLRRER